MSLARFDVWFDGAPGRPCRKTIVLERPRFKLSPSGLYKGHDHIANVEVTCDTIIILNWCLKQIPGAYRLHHFVPVPAILFIGLRQTDVSKE